MRGGERVKVVGKSWKPRSCPCRVRVVSVARGARSMAPSMARDRCHRPWPAIDGTVRGPRSMAPSVARDRWHRPWPAIDGTARESPGDSPGDSPGSLPETF